MKDPFPSEEFIRQLAAHAEREYPRECCGLILANIKAPHAWSRLIPCRNLQDDLHRKDPARFPRTSETAYFIDPAALLRIQKEARERGERIRCIYHSHPDAEPGFSLEDRAGALWGDEPLYPEAVYLIVSVRNGRAGTCHLYEWSGGDRKFVETGRGNISEDAV